MIGIYAEARTSTTGNVLGEGSGGDHQAHDQGLDCDAPRDALDRQLAQFRNIGQLAGREKLEEGLDRRRVFVPVLATNLEEDFMQQFNPVAAQQHIKEAMTRLAAADPTGLGWCMFPTITRDTAPSYPDYKMLPFPDEQSWTVSVPYCGDLRWCGDGECAGKCGSGDVLRTGAEECQEDFVTFPVVQFITEAPDDMRNLVADLESAVEYIAGLEKEIRKMKQEERDRARGGRWVDEFN